MKKYIFLMIAAFGMLCSSVSLTKADTIPSVNIDRVYDDIKTLGQSAGIKIDSIATKAIRIAGTTLENLWDILVQQQRVKAYTSLFILILGFIFLYNAAKWIKYFYDITTDADNPGPIFAIIGLIGFSIFVIMHNYFALPTIATGLFNPEYGALQDLYNIANGILH